jgi:lipopolysaccharide export LptBFGC system permease protein LptF
MIRYGKRIDQKFAYYHESGKERERRYKGRTGERGAGREEEREERSGREKREEREREGRDNKEENYQKYGCKFPFCQFPFSFLTNPRQWTWHFIKKKKRKDKRKFVSFVYVYLRALWARSSLPLSLFSFTFFSSPFFPFLSLSLPTP